MDRDDDKVGVLPDLEARRDHRDSTERERERAKRDREREKREAESEREHREAGARHHFALLLLGTLQDCANALRSTLPSRRCARRFLIVVLFVTSIRRPLRRPRLPRLPRPHRLPRRPRLPRLPRRPRPHRLLRLPRLLHLPPSPASLAILASLASLAFLASLASPRPRWRSGSPAPSRLVPSHAEEPPHPLEPDLARLVR